MISYTYECWKCSEDHYGSADNMEELKAIEQNLSVEVRVIG